MAWLPQPKQASSATMAIVYITVGALMDVWTTVYYIYLSRHGVESDSTYYWLSGFFFTGLVLMLIGFTLGYIGRSAKQAEVTAPPPGVATVPGVNPGTVGQPVVNAVPVTPPAPMPAPGVPTMVPR